MGPNGCAVTHSLCPRGNQSDKRGGTKNGPPYKNVTPIPPRGAAAVTALVNLSGSAEMAQHVATAPIH